MKVLHCRECGDLFNLTDFQETCSCGNVSGCLKEGDNIYLEIIDRTKAKLMEISGIFLQMDLHCGDIFNIPLSSTKVELVIVSGYNVS